MCPLVSKNSLKAARVRAPVHEGRKTSPRPTIGLSDGLGPQAGPPEGNTVYRLEGGVKVCFCKGYRQNP